VIVPSDWKQEWFVLKAVLKSDLFSDGKTLKQHVLFALKRAGL